MAGVSLGDWVIERVEITQSPNHPITKTFMTEFIKVATIGEIPVGGSKLVEVDAVRVALFNLAGQVYAIEDVCTHDGGPLVEGEVVNGCEVICPRHGARFDIRTGAALSFPAFEATNTYAVRIDGNDVWIESPL
jgi:3-phenylpropionate/trans-cinnamate dioxygenase ferredoxin subunit